MVNELKVLVRRQTKNGESKELDQLVRLHQETFSMYNQLNETKHYNAIHNSLNFDIIPEEIVMEHANVPSVDDIAVNGNENAGLRGKVCVEMPIVAQVDDEQKAPPPTLISVGVQVNIMPETESSVS